MQINNFCNGSPNAKKSFVEAEIHKTIVHYTTLILSTENLVCVLETSYFASPTPVSLFQVLLDLCRDGEAGKENRGLFRSFPEATQIYNFDLLPKAFRVVTSSLTSVECRSLAIR